MMPRTGDCMDTFEITIYAAMSRGLISKSVAKDLINKLLKSFSTEAYNAVVDEYVKILTEAKEKQ